MATFVKRSSGQGLLLLALVLMAFHVIPAPIRGQSIQARKGGIKTTIGVSGRKAVIQDDKFNGCHYNQQLHDESSIFCCSKDNQCWGQLTECVNNCPCHTCS